MRHNKGNYKENFDRLNAMKIKICASNDTEVSDKPPTEKNIYNKYI